MNEAINTVTRQDWFGIEQVINHADEIITYFKLSAPELDSIIRELKGSVLEGIFEYKKNSIATLLKPLESLMHSSRAIEQLPVCIESGRALLVVTLLQRLFCLKKIKISKVKPVTPGADIPRKPAETISQTFPLPEILQYIKKEVHSDPDKIKDAEVKKILMYAKMYQNEIKKMKDLAGKIPAEKRQSLQENFKQSLSDITIKLNIAYRTLLEGESPPRTAPLSASLLENRDYTPIAPRLKIQSKFFSEILSILAFTQKEKFQTRELLVHLVSRKEEFMKLIDAEQKKYEEIDPFDKKGLKAGKEISTEIVKFLQKEREWLKLHPWKT